jgi:hypothetical protein
MLRHQFGQHLVLGLDLLRQILDPFLFRLTVGARLGLESRCSIVEEFLLSTVEHRRLTSQFMMNEISPSETRFALVAPDQQHPQLWCTAQ